MAFSVLLRAIHSICRGGRADTDIAGSGKTRWRTGQDAGIVWCQMLLFVLLKECFGSVSGTCAKPLPVGDIPEFSRRMFANYYHRGLLFLKGKSSVQLGT